MRVYQSGVYLADVGDPYDLKSFAESYGYDYATLSLDLAEVKVYKELEIRDVASAQYQMSVRVIEADAIIVKMQRLKPLSALEVGVADEMEGRYTRMRQTINQVRNATTWQACLEIRYVYP